MTAMILQPKKGKTDEEIAAARERAIASLENKEYKIFPTFAGEGFSPEVCKQLLTINPPLLCLGYFLLSMSYCDTAYFCNGWELDRECRLEHAAAEEYGLSILYEE